jgi:WXG100 family type VII secretion target
VGQSVDVVVSELHSASARLADAAQRLQDGLSSVNDETTALLGSGWKGEAASAYAPVWEKWNDGAEQVVKGLQRMSELLTIAGKEYAKTDEQAAGALGSAMQGSGSSGGSGGSPTGGGPSAAGAGQSGAGQNGAGGAPDMAQQMNLSQSGSQGSDLSQAIQPLAQVGQAIAGLPQQAGQALAGLAQQAAQLAAGLAQQAEHHEPEGDGSPAAEDVKQADERAANPSDESARRPDEPSDGAAPSDGNPAGPAPVSPVSRSVATEAVTRPSE